MFACVSSVFASLSLYGIGERVIKCSTVFRRRMFRVDGYIKKKKKGTHLFVHLNVEAVGHFVILKNGSKFRQIKQF